MTIVSGAHLVGGIDAPDAESAMRVASVHLGRHLRRMTDGETGVRNQWIGFQIAALQQVPGISMGGMAASGSANEVYAQTPFLVVDGVDRIPDGTLGYAEAALESYAVFSRLRDEGVIARDVRFQVSLPTPYAVVVAWTRPQDHARFLGVYANALARDVRRICDAIPAADLAIQWDVAVEFGALTGNFRAEGEVGEIAFMAARIAECIASVPAGVPVGIHCCYGDLRHRHFAVPENLGLAVDLVNRVRDEIGFAWAHFPVDRETGLDRSYVAPLDDLRADGIEVSLGVVDYEGDKERTRALVKNAVDDTTLEWFSISTECGMGRISERGHGPTLAELLDDHAENATPIR